MIDGLCLIRITNQNQFESFKKCFNSYHRYLEPHLGKYIVCDDSIQGWKAQTKTFLDSVGAVYEYINNDTQSQSNHMYLCVSDLIGAVKSKYFVFIVDDVELFPYDVFTPSILALDNNADLLQVKIGGGKILNQLNRVGNKDYCRSLKWENMEYSDDTIYAHLATGSMMKLEPYHVSVWNTVTRTSIMLDIDKRVRGFKGGRRSMTFHDYRENICQHHPDRMSMLADYKLGWLNLKDYLYPYGRDDKTYLQKLEELK
jgi:hypothetical protein